MSKEVTQEQMRARILEHVRSRAAFWATTALDHDTIEARLDGLVCSILAMIDGSTATIPAIDLVLRPAPEDKRLAQSMGEDWVAAGLVVNEDCELASLYYRSAPARTRGTAPVPPRQPRR